MKVAAVYVYPMVNVRVYYPLAQRFAATYRQHPAGAEHELHVIANGLDPKPMDQAPFRELPVRWHSYNNCGWDIGAFQWAADHIECDLLLCLGAHCHFHRAGWLGRMLDVYVDQGPTLYGTRGYDYAGFHHIRTTCFWMPPILLQSYPSLILGLRADRYNFEHGADNFTLHVEKIGLEPLVVTWDQVLRHERWGEAGPDPTALLYDQWTNPGGSKLDRK